MEAKGRLIGRRLICLVLMAALLLAFMPSVAAAGAPAADGCRYVVRWGETLSGIAWRHGTTASALASMNGLWNWNYVRAGQVLWVPCGGPGPWHPAPGGCRAYYTVAYGDSLLGIAARFGTTSWAIAMANGIANPNVIYAGRTLCIR